VKRFLLFEALACSAFVMGCSHTEATWKPPANGTAKVSPNMAPPRPVTPESIITNLETPRERANYLKELSKDSKFDPKQHAEMLEKYANASEPDVAAAAKELVARAQ
jgi:hypothetical protein